MKRTIKAGLVLALILTIGIACQSSARADATADEVAIAQGNNAFAVDLYAQLAAGESGNLFFSPYSISSALAMTFDGARGQTAWQMQEAMSFPFGRSRLNAAYSALSNALDSGSQINGAQVYDLAVANSLWGQSGFTYSPGFLQTLQQDYGTTLTPEDFIQNPSQASQDINQWVADKTNNKITDLFTAGSFKPTTRLVLVNAIYFLGNWASPFDKGLTENKPFHLDAQDSVTVPMMQQTDQVPFMENDQLQIAQLPYVGYNLSMVILLPRQVDGLTALEASLTSDRLDRWLNRLTKMKVIVKLPKFQMTSQFELSAQLKALGMTDAFARSADFSGISTATPLHISQVVHKAFVDVNETGTEAAAVTVVEFEPTIFVPETVFRVNHPFLFLIRDNISGAILFMGRVTNPSS